MRLEHKSTLQFYSAAVEHLTSTCISVTNDIVYYSHKDACILASGVGSANGSGGGGGLERVLGGQQGGENVEVGLADGGGVVDGGVTSTVGDTDGGAPINGNLMDKEEEHETVSDLTLPDGWMRESEEELSQYSIDI